MKSIRSKAASISAAEIAAVAAQGVARAQAARQSAGEELNAEQVEQVSGAAVSLGERFLIYGYWRDLNRGGLGSVAFEQPASQAFGAKTLGV
jgi:hypothetical protein